MSRREPPKKIYIIHAGDGGIGGGEPYESKTLADDMAGELSQQEGAPWYVATYVLETAPNEGGDPRG